MPHISPSAQEIQTQVKNARLEFLAGRPSKAAEIIERMQGEFGLSVSGSELLSDIYYFSADYDRALDAIRNAIVLFSSTGPNPSLGLAIRKAAILSRQKRRAEAIDVLATLPAKGRQASFFRTLREAVADQDGITAFENVAGPNFQRSDMSCITALNHYAILLREKGHAQTGIAVARERFLRARKLFAFGRNAKPAVKPGWAEEASICLADLKREFEGAGVPFFLISGTFLGAYRDGGIIGHDKDIDVGVDEAVPVRTLVDLFSASPCFAVKEIPSQRTVYLSHASGVSVDVFIHYREDGRYWHEGVKVRWWNSPFDLTELNFLGGTYTVPAEADRYLTENYGTWQTPVSDFETFVDTPNMEVTSRDHMIWYYLTKLTDYYLLGRKPQFVRVWSALEAMHSLDRELRDTARWVIDHARPAPGLPPRTAAAHIAETPARGGEPEASRPWLPTWAIGPGKVAKRLSRTVLRRRNAVPVRSGKA